MTRSARFLVACALAQICAVTFSFAASSNWTDSQGNSFKAEPLATYGPFALFKTSATKGRRVLLRTLSPEDCVRFYKETSANPKSQRALDWSKATSPLSANFRNRLFRLDNDKVVRADLQGKAEPELYVCFFASSWEGSSYEMAIWYRATYDRLKRLYGDDVQVVYLGVRHDSNEGFMKAMRLPWYTVEYGDRASVDAYRLFAPENGAGMAVLNRHGLPLILTEISDLRGMKTFVDELNGLMGAADERNPLFWKDRAHYLLNIRPVQFADSAAPALLVWNPLRQAVLRKNGIERLSAKLQLDAGGAVTAVELHDREGLGAPLAETLEKAFKSNFLFLPAIDHGKAVASSYDFEYTTPKENPELENDREWVLSSGHKEIPVASWLLLRPIPVPPTVFSQVDHVDADGRNVMTAFKVGGEAVDKRAQMNAFNSDFFGAEGAGTLKPTVGQSVEIDERPYKWEAYESKDGLVEMGSKGKCDYSVGYAWSEFDAGNGGTAYLGLGSDDGVKIWLNGALVHDRWTIRPTQIDQDLLRLKLLPGKNTLLIKIQNQKDAWSFLFRLRQ